MKNSVVLGLSAVFIGLFAATPSSTNYNLNSFDIGSGGGATSSTNYGLNVTTNGQSAPNSSSTNFTLGPGLIPVQDASVPPAPTFSNPDNSYNRLNLVLNTASNPSDTKFAIAISSNDFVTTQFVKSDNSIGNNLLITDYQTYTNWGGASGIWVTGLVPNTTYKVKVKAMQGKFSETGYGPTATAITDQPSITFSVTTTLSGTPPFNVSFSSLAANTVYSADADPLLAITSNAAFGGSVYIYDTNAGLYSAASSYTIGSANADLISAGSGYGAQVISTGQASGGPISAQVPFNGVGDNVGSISTLPQPIISTSSPVNSGTATVRMKAKTDSLVPASNDYSDIVTFVAAMLF
jgi:hypothetical protein